MHYALDRYALMSIWLSCSFLFHCFLCSFACIDRPCVHMARITNIKIRKKNIRQCFDTGHCDCATHSNTNIGHRLFVFHCSNDDCKLKTTKSEKYIHERQAEEVHGIHNINYKNVFTNCVDSVEWPTGDYQSWPICAWACSAARTCVWTCVFVFSDIYSWLSFWVRLPFTYPTENHTEISCNCSCVFRWQEHLLGYCKLI